MQLHFATAAVAFCNLRAERHQFERLRWNSERRVLLAIKEFRSRARRRLLAFVSFASLVEASSFDAVPTNFHIAPAAAVTLTPVQKQPGAGG